MKTILALFVILITPVLLILAVLCAVSGLLDLAVINVIVALIAMTYQWNARWIFDDLSATRKEE